MATFDGKQLPIPRLRFDPAIPSQVELRSYQGLRRFGPYDASAVRLQNESLLFVFPEQLRAQVRELARAFVSGLGNYPGFEQMFRVPLNAQAHLTHDIVPVDSLSDLSAAADDYERALRQWLVDPTRADVDLAFVVIPQSDPWELDRPYYKAKALLTAAGIPTQMVTAELIADSSRLGWSVANIALAAFAKLGGKPWVVDAPGTEADLVVGVGRAEVATDQGRRRIFGYAISFVSDGNYQHTFTFRPAADERNYEHHLEKAIVAALGDAKRFDQPPQRFVFHLGKRTSRAEIDVVKRALASVNADIPAAFLRIDDSSSWDLMDFGSATYAAPKGIFVRLGPYRALLQSEGPSNLAPPRSPLQIELDRRSDLGPEALEELCDQAFRLSSANWRGFNARSKPVTLVYGQRLAQLVGYLEQTDIWKPETLGAELRSRPWFL